MNEETELYDSLERMYRALEEGTVIPNNNENNMSNIPNTGGIITVTDDATSTTSIGTIIATATSTDWDGIDLGNSEVRQVNEEGDIILYDEDDEEEDDWEDEDDDELDTDDIVSNIPENVLQQPEGFIVNEKTGTIKKQVSTTVAPKNNREQEILECVKEFFDEELFDFEKIGIRVGEVRSEAEYNLTIKFPEIIMRNSRNASHTIYDFYIRFNFDKNFNYLGVPTATRGRLTVAELLKDYGHSHKSSGNHTFTNLCLGNGPLASLNAELMYQKYNIHTLACMLASLETYASWESLEGGPYRKMQNLILAERYMGPNYAEVEALTKTILESEEKLKLSLTLDKTLFFNPNSDANIAIFDKLSTIKVKRMDTGEEFLSTNSQRISENVTTHLRRIADFTFKGKTVKAELYKPEETTSKTKEEKLVCPKNLIISVCQELTEGINEYYLNTHKYECE